MQKAGFMRGAAKQEIATALSLHLREQFSSRKVIFKRRWRGGAGFKAFGPWLSASLSRWLQGGF